MKKKLAQILILCTAFSCLTGCGKSTAGTNMTDIPVSSEVGNYTPTPAEEPVEINTSDLLSANIDLVDSVSALCPDENVMLSSLSLNFALSMLANGADGESLTALETFLGKDVEAANAYYPQWLNRPESDSANKLLISNSFWTDEESSFPIRDSYIDLLNNTYHAETDTIPMDEEGIDQVNAWINQATDGLVPTALSPDDLTPLTNSILINTILLDGKWASPFDANSTRDVKFTLADGSTTTVQGMYSKEYFYYENDYATGFKKSYEDNEYYMIAILPKEEGDFSLADLDIESFIASGKSTSDLDATLSIMLPKTDFEAKYNLTELLKSAGLEQIFDPTTNNFPGIYESDSPDFVSYASAIFQNDRLIIDEEGTRAAAATTVMIEASESASQDQKCLRVYLNRPFAILLMDGETDEPLFIAKVMNP